MNSAVMLGFCIMGAVIGESKFNYGNIGIGFGMILGSGLGLLLKRVNIFGMNE